LNVQKQPDCTAGKFISFGHAVATYSPLLIMSVSAISKTPVQNWANEITHEECGQPPVM